MVAAIAAKQLDASCLRDYGEEQGRASRFLPAWPNRKHRAFPSSCSSSFC
jgi:hypothetical protein